MQTGRQQTPGQLSVQTSSNGEKKRDLLLEMATITTHLSRVSTELGHRHS